MNDVGERLDGQTIYISFNGPINDISAQYITGTAMNLVGRGASGLYFLFSTGGGIVADGLTLYNMLKALPAEITMHNVGNVDSIGNAVFLAGKKRYACKHATFLFHGVSRRTAGGEVFTEKDASELLAQIQAEHVRIGGVLTDETALKAEEVHALFLKSETKDASFALERGIIQEIRPALVPEGAKMIPIMLPVS